MQPMWGEENQLKNNNLPDNIELEKLRKSPDWLEIAKNSKWATYIDKHESIGDRCSDLKESTHGKWYCGKCDIDYKLKSSLARHKKQKHLKELKEITIKK